MIESLMISECSEASPRKKNQVFQSWKNKTTFCQQHFIIFFLLAMSLSSYHLGLICSLNVLINAIRVFQTKHMYTVKIYLRSVSVYSELCVPIIVCKMCWRTAGEKPCVNFAYGEVCSVIRSHGVKCMIKLTKGQ